MFSEYASRFLAQSQSRLSNLGQPDPGDRPSRPTDWQSRGSRLAARPFLGRGGGNNPYQPSGSRFGSLAAFGSRYATNDAPLFQATLEHDDEDEEEAADLFALQRSRRVFAAGRLEESAETDNDDSRASLERSQDYEERGSGLGERLRGIRSSWNGTKSTSRRDGEDRHAGDDKGKQRDSPRGSEDSSRGMEDVALHSTIADSEPPEDLMRETAGDSDPPAFQKFLDTGAPTRQFARRESTSESELGLPRPPSSLDTNLNGAPAAPAVEGEIFKHDAFFAWLYLIALASLFSTFVLVVLHTDRGDGPLGDTIYTTLRASFHLLAVDTLVSIIVSLVWLAALRSFVKPLVGLVMVAVPVVLISFSLYPFISSYQSTGGSTRFQDTVMRWAAAIPAVSAVVWLYVVYKGRHALQSAVGILEFSSRILAANSALVLVGLGCLAVVVSWTWIWLLMFTRVFLGGSFSSKLARFIISASSWWLGVYFILMYIWTLSIISGVQRSTAAATVSQWYFHRNAVPAPSTTEVVSAALGHATTTIFGTISLSTLLALAIRLPLLVLPQRLANLLSMFVYSFIPTPIAALTNPLTLTYAAIHSQTLAVSSRGLSQMDFIAPQRPTTTLTPAALPKHNRYSPLLPYRLAKLILHATRFIMAIALGFAGWVMTARQLKIDRPDGLGVRGSAYAYVVGLIASFIGWGILGAMEGILSGIVDAVVICYGSEKRMATGAGGYCMEAAFLFGDRRGERERDEVY
ncbi:choline transporter-like protein ctl1 [Staphylotrichum tortipilum]|uniref:Protein PNS1 n=1 Tax=Staphylotrichum tortipilum TaxID=2831512 RepID=A0AAN6MRS0_9PEZI|nr:choline transporter-like protein ctl1 [Staphylotrichum longicolle]